MKQHMSDLPLPPHPELDVILYGDLTDVFLPLPSLADSTQNCRLLKANRGKHRLFVGEHLYIKDKELNEKMYWCENRDCGSTFHTVIGMIAKWHISTLILCNCKISTCTTKTLCILVCILDYLVKTSRFIMKCSLG